MHSFRGFQENAKSGHDFKRTRCEFSKALIIHESKFDKQI